MAELIVAKTYGEGLFYAAVELNKTKEILDDARELSEILKSEPEFAEFLISPSIPAHEKNKVLETVFGGKVCVELLNLLGILIRKGRVAHFHKIVDAYAELLNREEGVSYGKIVSVNKLSDEQLQKFEAETGKLLRKKKVKLDNETDTKLIGGVKIYIEGKIIDASVKTRLQALADSLV